MKKMTKTILDSILPLLSKNIPWFPLDFIKSVFVEGGKESYVKELCKELNLSDDLRFVFGTDDIDRTAVFAEKLPWDSLFFGYGVGKINGIFPLTEPFYRPYADYTNALKSLIEYSKEKGIKYLFANADSRDLALIQAMGRLGFSLIETRLAYHRDIRDYEYKERYSVRLARNEDIPSLGSTVIQMVNMYDRFHSDPFIAKHDVDRLMYKWIEASIKEGFADVTFVPDVDNPKAFVTVKFHKENWEKWNISVVQPMLSAVGPENRGWYRRLISEINYHACAMGIEHSYMTTQATNFAVLWVWETLGYHYGKCEHVFRIIL